LIITISGPPGSGKSTLSKILSVRLGLELVSMGDIFRKCANERCMSLEEFGQIAKCNEKIDREIDEMQKQIALEKDFPVFLWMPIFVSGSKLLLM
jgi:cytidylate kinase